jgi:hypothetical protein
MRQRVISVRTVQRRVAELMEKAGVTTRIQLGAEAVRRLGVIDATDRRGAQRSWRLGAVA